MDNTKHYKVILLLVLCLSIIRLETNNACAQTINLIASADFGSFDFDTTYNAQLKLGTDGNITISGSGIVSNGGEIAGHIRITLPNTGIVEIKCPTQATLTDPTATTLTIQNIEIAVNTGVAFGSGITCLGSGGGDPVTTTIDMDALPDPDVFIGGEIDISSAITLPADHVYNTTGTGTPITLSIIVQ